MTIRPSTEVPADRYQVGSVARAMRLVGMVANSPDGLSLTEIARHLGMSKSAVHALARTLVGGGYLRTIEPGPRYIPGIELVRLGEAARQSIQLVGVCRPELIELSRVTGLTTRAAIAEDGYPVFIDRIDAPGMVRFHTPLGVRELPHTSAAGKAILAALPPDLTERIAADTGLPHRTPNTIRTLEALIAELEIVRDRGFAVDDEEDVLGVICIAATFSDHAGMVAGAISATGLSHDIQDRGRDRLADDVRAAADRITVRLGGGARFAEEHRR